MQVLVAPTRGELDRAHSKGDWMDVGVASIRNLFKISWNRTLLWGILALSSVPIHLLYNSAVFKSIGANEYILITANPDWLKGEDFNRKVGSIDPKDSPYGSSGSESLLSGQEAAQRYFHENLDADWLISNLSISECMSTYGTTFVSGHSHVVAITNRKGNSSKETLFYASANPATAGYVGWMCQSRSGYCQLHSLQKGQDWQIGGMKIEYCLSQLQPQHCAVRFSVHILVAVICMNALKSVVMFITLYGQKKSTLVTVGDAIASYLDRPDDYTTKRCLIDRGDMGTWRKHGASKPMSRVYQDGKGSRWFSAVRSTVWVACLLLVSAAIIASGFLIGMGVSSIKASGASSPWSLGWGAIDPNAMIQGSYSLPQDGTRGLIVSVLLANCPQALVSFLYLLYNSLLTSLLLAKEWTTYNSRCKGLRVTTRSGLYQRSTYCLHLPFRYSIPLLCTSAILHWVISQSIFLVRVDYYSEGEKQSHSDGSDSGGPDSNGSNIGFSLPPILTAMIIGFLMLAFIIGLGFRKLGNMPVAGSCSVAISAACHRPEDDVDAAVSPVQWGEVQGTEDGIGHACFTFQAVTPLVPGRIYA